LDERITKFEAIWTQIAEYFKDKDLKLMFEPLNEPAGSATEQGADQYNMANQLFVNIVRGSGSNNTERLITLSGLNMNIANTVEW